MRFWCQYRRQFRHLLISTVRGCYACGDWNQSIRGEQL